MIIRIILGSAGAEELGIDCVYNANYAIELISSVEVREDKNSSQLHLTVSSEHTEEQLEDVVTAFRKTG